MPDWKPKGRFSVKIDTHFEAEAVNDGGLLPVRLECLRNADAGIKIIGNQSKALSLYRSEAVGYCLKIPNPDIDLISINFIEDGEIDFRCLNSRVISNKNIAVMVKFSESIEIESTGPFVLTEMVFSTQSLIDINAALTGDNNSSLPIFSIKADVSALKIQALICSLKSVYNKSQAEDLNGDHTFSLVQEIVGYQILSSWPKEVGAITGAEKRHHLNRLKLSKDYIEENIYFPLALSDISAAAGMSVRALQANFRRHFGLTPFGYIINKRLTHVHEDLMNIDKSDMSIREIARHWGFIHVSDFGRRYQLKFGCTPTETRKILLGNLK